MLCCALLHKINRPQMCPVNLTPKLPIYCCSLPSGTCRSSHSGSRSTGKTNVWKELLVPEKTEHRDIGWTFRPHGLRQRKKPQWAKRIVHLSVFCFFLFFFSVCPSKQNGNTKNEIFCDHGLLSRNLTTR